ncbi:FAD-dependent oxidoreductase [Pseudomonas helleri]|uniref:FAD-dependent oxidoreductase n=1 Tax=Pseudomonas helleri TaxID=1608996 RepID=A0A6A7YVQ9_9PSED|nr:FAD-dependent oxidoreductase [Pseudomonas helleri]MQT25596.1 FAD-dependent oxidoreductase [Pseudomonas helleri]MQT80944.1 FAD-dependent oxidoreductase [Pseudomonas helleri]MQU17097.1 FAD-dependent oxidoreductase [Pseudomonas helleri]MQU26762.1 FAD-dependent oxidoreductase [Pseudomonas helleri]
MNTQTNADSRSLNCDLLVIGSGASGLAAAVTAAAQGLKVIVVEKHETFGGATAWSGGWLWIPGNPLAKRAGIHEDPQQPRTYLRNELGSRYNAERIDAFLDNAPRMVSFFEEKTTLKWVDGNGIPDIHGRVPGAAVQGHQVIAAPYDAREMGPLIHRLRKTMRETSFLGMPIMAGPDLAAFLSMTRSLKSFIHVTKRFLSHLRDLTLHGRAMHLVNGVALVARLAKSAVDLGVTLIESAPARELILNQGKVVGAIVDTPDGPTQIHANRGVVLATGGFPNDMHRRKALFPRTSTDEDHLALPPVECSGDGISLGESAGGELDIDVASPAAWAPVSLVRHRNGTIGHFPHIIDRAKPGLIGVLSTGKRFVNEADGYYDYTAAMVAGAPEGEEVASWLICDHRFQRRFGLGHSRPFPLPVGPSVRSGYLQCANSIKALAEVCGIDPAGLHVTVRNFNEHARNGEDPEFGRGSTPYNRKQGDPLIAQGNPCVAPIEQGPFYAVKVRPGCFGTFAGLKTNGHAQVLDRSGTVITGLYAVGTDMASVMGGFYPSGGINLGPAMTFGYIVGLHAASEHPLKGQTPSHQS